MRKGRPMFHLEVKVYENDMLIRGFSTPRRFQDVMWAELYFRYLQYLAGKFYPIYVEYCINGSLSSQDKATGRYSWFIYHCPVYLKKYLNHEEVIAIYEMCRAQYYLDHPDKDINEVKINFTMVQKYAKY